MLLALATAVFAAACSGSSTDNLEGSSSNVGDPNDPNNPNNPNNPNDPNNPGTDPEPTALDDRQVDYNEALRTASLKLVRSLPTLEQIKRVHEAGDLAAQKAAYEAELDAMFEDPRFTARMIKWWRDVMRQGGGADGDQPSRETAPVFAARMVVEGRPYTDLFTATADTCPTYDEAANTFASGECNNNVPAHAGVLTNPGVQFQFYSNMAFRRVRWVQEIFTCAKFPAEQGGTPTKMGAGDYTNPWQFEAVTGGAEAFVNFQDTSSVVCANCHNTMNRIAPLFANFDMNGMWQDSFQVQTPASPDPVTSEFSHYLRDGEPLAWRFGKEVTNLTELGAQIAEDPIVHECAVARAWNFAMSKEDIVSEATTVPTKVLQPYLDDFKADFNFKQVLLSIFKSEDFVSF